MQSSCANLLSDVLKPCCCLQIDGIWHTAIVVGGLEYYYGGGVNQSIPGSTPFGQPLQKINLGYVTSGQRLRSLLSEPKRSCLLKLTQPLQSADSHRFQRTFEMSICGTCARYIHHRLTRCSTTTATISPMTSPPS